MLTGKMKIVAAMLVLAGAMTPGIWFGGTGGLAAQGQEPKQSAQEAKKPSPDAPAAPRKPAEKWQDRATLREPTSICIGVAFSSDGKTAATATFGSTVEVWDLAKSEVRIRLKTDHRWNTSVAISPDGKTLASVGADRVVKVWDLATGKEQKAWSLVPKDEQFAIKDAVGPSGGYHRVAYSPDGKCLAAAAGKVVKILDATTGKEQVSLDGHAEEVRFVAYALGGKVLVTAGVDGAIKLWDVDTAKERITLQAQGPPRGDIALSADGKTLAASDTEAKTVTVWDVETGKEKATLKDVKVHRVALSPDGKVLATGTSGNTLRAQLWDVATGKESVALKVEGLGPFLTALRFSPDGKILAASGYEVDVDNDKAGDSVLHLWELRE
jgi:WD40 repeat protein